MTRGHVVCALLHVLATEPISRAVRSRSICRTRGTAATSGPHAQVSDASCTFVTEMKKATAIVVWRTYPPPPNFSDVLCVLSFLFCFCCWVVCFASLCRYCFRRFGAARPRTV